MHAAKLCCASGLSASSADLSFPCIFHTGLCIFMGGEKTASFPTPPFPVGCIFRKVGTSSFHAVVNTCQVWMRFSPGNELLGGGWQNWKHDHLPFWFRWQKARTEVLNKHCKAWNKRGRVQVWGGTSTGRLLLEHTVELKTLRGHTAIKLLEFQRPHPGCDLPNILQYCILAA